MKVFWRCDECGEHGSREVASFKSLVFGAEAALPECRCDRERPAVGIRYAGEAPDGLNMPTIFEPFVSSTLDACPAEDCALQRGHSSPHYPIERLFFESVKARLRAARRSPLPACDPDRVVFCRDQGAPEPEATGGAERLGKITSRVSVPSTGKE